MGWFIAALVIGAAVKAIGAIASNANERKETREQAEYDMDQANLREQALDYEKDTALGNLEKQTGIAQQDAYSQAAATEKEAIGQYTEQASQTYLGQLAAEENFMDLRQAGFEAQGQMTATTGASGIRKNDTLGGVLDRQIAQKETAARRSIDASRDGSMYGAGRQLERANSAAGLAREQFQQGSAYMNLYDYRRERIEGAADIQALSIERQKTYLQDTIDEQDYGKDSWFWIDLLSVAGAASDAYSQGYSLGAW